MTDQNNNQDWRENDFDYGKYRFFYRILGGAVLVGIFAVIGDAIFSKKQEDYWLSIFTNGLAIAFGVFVIDQLARQREEARFKADLIYKMGSRVKDEAVRAVEEIKWHKWHEDGSLHRKLLEKANLQDADLRFTDLRGAHLVRANLKDVDLLFADLRGAFLYGSDLSEATLEAPGGGKTLFDENTLLPDASYWTPVTDMRRFTDPTHPNFWRSDDPSSPAYRGKKNE